MNAGYSKMMSSNEPNLYLMVHLSAGMLVLSSDVRMARNWAIPMVAAMESRMVARRVVPSVVRLASIEVVSLVKLTASLMVDYLAT